jgi:hypothetical protein
MTATSSPCVRLWAGSLVVFTVLAVLVTTPTAAVDNPSSPPGSPAQPASQGYGASPARQPQAVTIIESASGGHSMDTVWAGVATAMGHTPTISPQTTLDDTGFFATTDILIVSSGVIGLPGNRVATIQQFIEQGGPVFLQSEYVCSWDTDVAFATIVANLGGSHTWIDTISGDLQPMNVLGIFATTPNNVPSLSYFWYGCRGTGGAAITPFLEYGGDYYGFAFKSTNPAHGVLITTTDQDWVQSSTSPELMENILTSLETGTVPVGLQDFRIE